ncbi:MAG: HAMP domain-containing protein, partial [Chloroflexi bacterium]|nr:HAMP domain-containing protein [Chloroflexota bacterium]
MRIGGFTRTLGFQLAVAMSLLIVAVGSLVVWHVNDLLRDGEHEHFTEHIARSRSQIARQLSTDRELVATGAVILANQPEMRAAIAAGDVVGILQIATDYYNRTGPALQGAAGLQVYDARGELVVRAHDPLRGQQGATPPEVIAAIETHTSLGVLRIDEILGPALSGIAPVMEMDGTIIGVIEALTALDRTYLHDHEAPLDVNIALITTDAVVAGNEAFQFRPDEITGYDRTATQQGNVSTLDLGGTAYLATLLPLTSFDGSPVGDLYLGVREDLVFEAVHNVRMAVLRATAIGALVALTLSAGLAFVAVRPIRELAVAARRIQGNDLDTPVTTEGPTEVADLGHALDDLRVAMRQTREAMLNVNRDIANQFERSSQSLSEVTLELAAMHSILRALSSDSPEGLAGVTEHLTEIGWADGALIAVADADGHLSSASSFGLTPAAGSAILQAIEGGIGTQQLENGIYVRDSAAQSETARLLTFDVDGFAAEPIVEPDGVAGAIVITSARGLDLRDSRRDLLRAVAREVALTLERTELAGAVEESRRIAESALREMSDGVLVLDRDGRCV